MTNKGFADPQPPDPAGGSLPAAESTSGRAWRRLRNRLLEGLLVVLPILITFWVFSWAYSNLFRYVIKPLTVLVIWKVQQLQREPELPDWFENYVAPLVALLLALAILYGCGALAHTRFRRSIDRVMLRVPVFSYVYDAVRNVLQCFERPAGQASPQRVVLVAFPHPGMRLPAIVTSTCRDVATGRTLLCVYVPTTPMPTSGYFLMVPEDEATELNWNVQQTLQAIISGGLTAPREVTFFRNLAAPVRPADGAPGMSQSAPPGTGDTP
jgi:uncharacterized membrane protein